MCSGLNQAQAEDMHTIVTVDSDNYAVKKIDTKE
jgi:hypothetical protein